MANFNLNKNTKFKLIRLVFVGATLVATTGVVGIKLGRADGGAAPSSSRERLLLPDPQAPLMPQAEAVSSILGRFLHIFQCPRRARFLHTFQCPRRGAPLPLDCCAFCLTGIHQTYIATDRDRDHNAEGDEEQGYSIHGEPGQLVSRLPCGHRFHQRCWNPWVIASRSNGQHRQLTCPMCTQPVDRNDPAIPQTGDIAPAIEQADDNNLNVSRYCVKYGAIAFTISASSAIIALSQPSYAIPIVATYIAIVACLFFCMVRIYH